MTDTLPAGVTFVSATGRGLVVHERRQRVGHVHPAGARLRGDGTDITVTVTAPTQASSITNAAVVSAVSRSGCHQRRRIDHNLGSGIGRPQIAKTGPATVQAGGRLVYTLSVTNPGPSSAQTVSVLDTLPSGVAVVSAAGAGWSCSHAANVSVTCTRPALGSG